MCVSCVECVLSVNKIQNFFFDLSVLDDGYIYVGSRSILYRASLLHSGVSFHCLVGYASLGSPGIPLCYCVLLHHIVALL